MRIVKAWSRVTLLAVLPVLALTAQQTGPIRLRANIIQKPQHIINGARKDADLWTGDLCNQTHKPYTFPRGDVRNALRREGVEALSDADGANVILQGRNTGRVAVLKRLAGISLYACGIISLADKKTALGVGCAIAGEMVKPDNPSLSARTPPVEENVARIVGEGNLDLVPGACSAFTIITNPQRKTHKPRLRTIEIYLQAPPVELAKTANSSPGREFSARGVSKAVQGAQGSAFTPVWDTVETPLGLESRPVPPLLDLAYRAGLPEAPEPDSDGWAELMQL